MKSPSFEVVIIGGGCAGASTALALLQKGVTSIAIVEKSDFSQPRVGETIQPPTSQLLKQLGVWEDFLKEDHLPSSGVASAWGTSELEYTDFIFRTYGKGWHLDRNAFDTMLLRLAVERGATLFAETRLKNATKTENGWTLQCGNTKLDAQFVVDASGRACAFAKLQGAHKIQFDDLYGIYTYWEQPKDALETFGAAHTLVESVEHGWWYSALLPNGTLAVALMTDTEVIKTHQLKHTENYLDLLQQTTHTAARISRLTQVSSPAVKVANAYELDTMVGDGWLAVGDSASAYDPLSSFGIHKALQNSLEAGAAIQAALCGHTRVLKDYAQNVQHAFEGFLTTRYQYYAMETRWQDSPFWKARQQPISVHPLQEIKARPNIPPKKWNRILPNHAIQSLLQGCSTPTTAAQLVQDFQKESAHGYPDWRVIQAVSYLFINEAIG